MINQERSKLSKLSIIPLGGQEEIGLALWVISYAGELLLVDAGATYPGEDLPGVDLLLPNTNFLQANQDNILALLLTNGHEEHSGAVGYLLNHLKIPRILAPRFVSSLILQNLADGGVDAVIDTIETRHTYQIGPFNVEWLQVNDAIADACALNIECSEGRIIYTSSFKLDQTPVDGKLADVARLAQIGDQGVLLLLSDSAGIETTGYTPSEKSVTSSLHKYISTADGRVIVVVSGTNTHRLQVLFDLASKLDRKVVLVGETLIKAALVAAVTGNLIYDRKIEAGLDDLKNLNSNEIMVVATGADGDPMQVLNELAYGLHKEVTLSAGDLIVYSADIYPGRSRQMANILDQFLLMGVTYFIGIRDGVHVSKHAGKEELKLMLSITKPNFFVPALGEGRHTVNHAHLAIEWGLSPESVFPLQNGEILEIGNGIAAIIGSVESEAVLYNRDQGEKVTTFSVKERKNLSLEGVLLIGLVVDDALNLLSGPIIEASASGYLQSSEWLAVREQLCQSIKEILLSIEKIQTDTINYIRTAIRDMASKIIKSRLQAKPTIQVILHMVATNHL